MMAEISPIKIEIFKHLFASVPEEMGVILRKTAYSPNIKERRDFSCALFDAQGQMVAQAAHIPVHLGSMPLSVAAAIQHFGTLEPGDVVILNDPFRGGTHLPDITLVSPIYDQGNGYTQNIGFVASRAHHADIGGAAPGSMAVAREIFQEGLIIPPVRLFRGGELDQAVFDLILANVRTPAERLGDLWAQVAANQRGSARLLDLVHRYGFPEVSAYMQALLDYTERMTRRLIARLPDGTYAFTDYLDDDGVSDQPVPISVSVTIAGEHATIDFTGSAPQVAGSLNAVRAITLSAVAYVILCLVGQEIPSNAGSMRPIDVLTPPGSVVDARFPAPVAGGNVETSQRIVDVLLGALSQALPGRIPAASQGTMNNLTIGGWDSRHERPFTYYETIGGGMGARPGADGPSAVHSHMTNTLNTPIEALEYAYPLRVVRYEIRQDSGGKGKFNGGDGIRRDIQALVDCEASLISERRQLSPYGLDSGENGASGENVLIRQGEQIPLTGKGTVHMQSGDILSIRTPGGGGFGRAETTAEQPGD